LKNQVAAVVAAVLVPFAGVAIGSAGVASAATTCGRVSSDFNGDGYADAAVSQSYWDAAAQVRRDGGLHVVYGSPTGLAKAGNQYIDAASLGTGGVVGSGYFGMIAATGDFNGDCYADLAVDDWSGSNGQGAVYVVYGSPAGLDPATNTYVPASALSGANTVDPHFGTALAAGDLNGDGYADLAAGAWNANSAKGGVEVLYGSAAGVTAGGARWITQGTAGVTGASGAGNDFGGSVTIADFNGDHFADLAVGAPGQTVDGQAAAGSVTVLPGSASGITTSHVAFITESTSGVAGTATAGDYIGNNLTAGDVTGDGRADLIIDGTYKNSAAGVIWLLKGTASGLTGTGSQQLSQNTAGVPGTSEPGDEFGWMSAVGDINGDG
jgi:hypothetical protein